MTSDHTASQNGARTQARSEQQIWVPGLWDDHRLSLSKTQVILLREAPQLFGALGLQGHGLSAANLGVRVDCHPRAWKRAHGI